MVTDEIDYLTADEEDRHVVAQANTPIDDDGRFAEDRVLVRRKGGEVDYDPAGRGRLHGRVRRARWCRSPPR